VWSNAASSAGTLITEVYKNGVATGLQAVLASGGPTQWDSTTQAVGADTFVADDRLDIRVTTIGWTPTTADIVATFTVAFS
jgi:hypothetical protein